MSALTIKTDVAGKLVEVKIDDKVIDNVSDVSQTLTRGTLVATIKASFDSITVTEQSGEPAPALTVSFKAGTVDGATSAIITESAGAGNHFAYKVADTAQETPNVNDVVMGATTYVSGNNITGVTSGKSVAIYELTTENKVVKFAAHTLTEGEIYTTPAPVPAPALTVSFAAGSVASSTAATISETATEGNHFGYAIAAEAQATPNVGDAVSDATTYTSGEDITGVAEGNHVGIYELTADNKAVRFTTHELTSGEVNAKG